LSSQRALVALTLLVLLFCAPMFATPDGFVSGDLYRDNDWLTDRYYDLAARRAILEHGVFPLRSELIGGGYPTIGHPFDGSWAPTLLAILLFGPVIGVKVNLALLLLLGAGGVFALGRRWLDLPVAAAAFAAAAFALSGWLPSMMLVGFWPQALYCVTPAILALLLSERPSSRILAGALFFLLLQQGGRGVAAVGAFLAAATWVRASVDTGWNRGAVVPLMLPLVGTAGAAFAWRLESIGHLLGALVLGGVVLGLSRRTRATLRAARQPLARLAAVLLVTLTLGIGKLVALGPLLEASEYPHAAHLPPTLWILDGQHRPERDEHFLNGGRDLVEALVARAPAEGLYRAPPDGFADGVPLEPGDWSSASREYGWVGLSWPVLLLALLGAWIGLRRGGGGGQAAVLLGGACAVCLGPHLVPDLHFLLAGGIPGLRGLIQPVKYYSFFILLPATLLAGLGARTAFAWMAPRIGTRWAAGLIGATLIAPLVQNAPIWADRFAEPLPEWTCDGCEQVLHVGHRDWAGWDRTRIDAARDRLWLREGRRPPNAREYDNALRGVGTIDWYGTLHLAERATPSHFVTPSGAVIPNPEYRGAAWLKSGRGTVRAVDSGPNVSVVTVDIEAADRLVLNATWLPGFVSDAGPVIDEDGRLAIDLAAGRHVVSVAYQPRATIAGLAASAVFAVLWGGLFVVVRRRERTA